MEFTDFGQIESRPQFAQDINSDDVVPKSVLAVYQFAEKVPCGLKHCHRPHNKGVLVEMTDGRETNLGHECGANHFGETFDDLKNSFIRRSERARQLQRIDQFKSRKDEILAKLRELNQGDYGVKWVANTRRRLLEIVGPAVSKQLGERARGGQPVVFEERERGVQEIERLMAQNPNARRSEFRYESVKVGELEGLDFVGVYPEVILDELRQQVHQIASTDYSDKKDTDRRKALRSIDGFDVKFKQIDKALSAAPRFLASKNTELFVYLPDTPTERAKAKEASLSWRLPASPDSDRTK